ncbi:MAG: hypothetical protein K1X89_21720 [Myxococcaceae bacterium]|nr:hypothetical protein [Myxococcaceae bacterium]
MKSLPMVVLVLVGCGGAQTVGGLDDGLLPPESLTGAQTLDVRLVPFDIEAQVQVRRTLHDPQFVPLALGGQGGAARLTLDDGALTLESLTVRFDDLDVPAQMLPPDGVGFRELRLTLEGRARGPLQTLGDTGEREASLTVDLALSGALRTAQGTQSPFDTQHFAAVPLRLSLSTAADGREEVRLRLDRRGPTWQWAGLLDTQDVHLAARALQTPYVPR